MPSKKKSIKNISIHTLSETQLNKQIDADVAKLKSAFLDFSTKYGDYIAGITIAKIHGCSWSIWDIMWDGRLWHRFDKLINTKK